LYPKSALAPRDKRLKKRSAFLSDRRKKRFTIFCPENKGYWGDEGEMDIGLRTFLSEEGSGKARQRFKNLSIRRAAVRFSNLGPAGQALRNFQSALWQKVS